MENARISGWQFYVLVLNFIIGNAFFLRPTSIVAVAKQDGWIVPLWAGAIGCGLAWLWLLLAKHHPGLSIVQICIKVAGKPVGGLMALTYIWFFIQIASWVTRNLGDFMNVILMPRTPFTVFHIMFLAVVCYASIKGVETISRVSELLAPIMVLILLTICAFTFLEWKWERFEPLFQLNVWKTMKETKSIIGFPYMEAVLLMMVVPYVKRKIKTGYFLGIASATLLLSGVVFVTIGALGVTRATHFTYPLYIITQELRIADFIEHVELTIVIIWIVWIFIKLCLAYHCAVTGICQLFQLKDRTWIALPLILVVSGFAITFSENTVEGIEWDKHYGFPYMSVYGIIYPALLLLLMWIRKAFLSRKGEAS
ncbi:MAG: germination protein [Paenibacillus sp.]|nr:germination protein [Paenibacillus sp.]